jgi:hypothetical protein
MDLNEAQKQRIMQLNELDEIMVRCLTKTTLIQQQRARWHDKFIKKKLFKVGDWDFLFDSKYKYFQGKFTNHWLGPYEIQ